MSQDCIFCKIAHGQIPVTLLVNNEHVAAFRDANPEAPVHILIVPKKHLTNMLQLSAEHREVMSAMYIAATALARQEGIAESGFRIVVNTGADAGQTVQHLHFHLLGGRKLGWPPG